MKRNNWNAQSELTPISGMQAVSGSEKKFSRREALALPTTEELLVAKSMMTGAEVALEQLPAARQQQGDSGAFNSYL